MHGHTFDRFVPPIEQTASFCGMRWLPPLVVHGSHHASEDELRRRGFEYKDRVQPFSALGGPEGDARGAEA